MSEELDLAAVDADVKESLEIGEPDVEQEGGEEYSEAEQKALDKGWKPEGVEGKRNVSAEEFLDKESFFDRIHKLEQSQKRKDKAIEALQEFNKQTEEKAYNKAVKDLKAAKKEAARDEDLERVIEIDEQIESLTDAKAEHEAAAPAAPAHSPEEWQDAFVSFKEGNSWYEQSFPMTRAADTLGTGYLESHPTASPEDVYKHVISTIKKEFPQEFENKQRKRPAAVGASSKGGASKAGKGKYSLKDVSAEDMEMAKVIIGSGVSEEDYLKSYFIDK